MKLGKPLRGDILNTSIAPCYDRLENQLDDRINNLDVDDLLTTPLLNQLHWQIHQEIQDDIFKN